MNLKHYFIWSCILGSTALSTLISCENQAMTDINNDAEKVNIHQISPEMAKVRDYVPKYAVMAHRGSTFWVPEETEAAYRWAREIGADYLECDLQSTKDGVILALHDDNLKRTTNIENVFGEDVPRTRAEYYKKMGMSESEAQEQYKKDRASFTPYFANQYMYEELLQLDAGTWFNQANLEQARQGFSKEPQYISTLEDLVNYAKGMKLLRGADKKRIYTLISENGKAKYEFRYVQDDVDSGHRPGIYLEFKESWLNPKTFEQDVFNELDRLDFNAITKPSSDTNFYVNGKVNVGNTNGKVILQTFSLESLRRAEGVFKGQIPMCFLLWEGKGATDLKYPTPQGYASFINLGLLHKAHIIGPSIAGAPNDYPEMNAPWQAHLIKRSGMLNHPYSFDSREQMAKYLGDYNYGNSVANDFKPPYLDGVFTNRSEMTIQYFIDKGYRPAPAPQKVPDPLELLDKLGYTK